MAEALKLVSEKASSSVFISDALASRALRPGDSAGEKQALLALASAMVRTPSEVLPQFVELAMQLTGGSSAGLSLYEPNPSPGIFRWRYLHGLLAPFENATTPRNDSPCGVTLDRNCPTLSAHPELIYDWISAHNLIIPEVLLVPLYIGTTEPLGTLWIVASSEGHFHQGHSDTARELASFVDIALTMIREEERLREALSEQEMVAREMSHRLKNLFAMTDSMIRGSARNTETVQEMAEALSGRLHALANAHSLVQNRVSALGSEKVSDITELISAVLEVHRIARDSRPRITTRGASIPCGDHATNSVALVIHELATNAAKYGALSTPSGHLDVEWQVEGEELVIRWTELGGPAVFGTPSRVGFGSTLIARTVERQFGGSLEYDWRASGLFLTIRMDTAKFTN